MLPVIYLLLDLFPKPAAALSVEVFVLVAKMIERLILASERVGMMMATNLVFYYLF